MNRATPLPSASPRALEPNPRLSREVLLASARFVYENSHRLSPDDSQFAKGMVAVLEAGRTLTPRQRREIARHIFEMEDDAQVLADCDRRAAENFQMLERLEAENAERKAR